jgi:hypothetical protein
MAQKSALVAAHNIVFSVCCLAGSTSLKATCSALRAGRGENVPHERARNEDDRQDEGSRDEDHGDHRMILRRE